MLGSLLTRGLVMAFGYAYPAYECYKTVERNKPEIEQLRFWCQYWILVACLTVLERIGDAFISWVPMYSEAKLAFFIYLWYPKTKGTTYVYDSFFRPYVAKHEDEIDRNLLELRTRAGDMAILYWQRAASYGQTRIFEVLQYVAAQSTPRAQSTQQQRGPRARQPPNTPKGQTAPKPQPQSEEPPSPTFSTSSTQHDDDDDDDDVAEETVPSNPKPAPPGSTSDTQNSQNAQSARNVQNAPDVNAGPENSSQSLTLTEAQPTQIETEQPSSENENENANPPPKESIMEETIRMTRGRLRKTRSAGTR